MKTCINMANGKVYVIDGTIEEAAEETLATDELVRIPGTDDRDDFYINPLQVCAVFPARPE